jgi:hypothetical protein
MTRDGEPGAALLASDGRTLPLSLLGAPASGVRRAFAVRLASLDSINMLAGGAIDPWQVETFVRETAAAGGLFDEAIFGPLRRDGAGRLQLQSWAEEPRDRPQARRCGMLFLPVPLVHPWALRTRGERDATLWRALAACEQVVVDGRLVPSSDALEDPRALVSGEAIFALVRAGRLPRTAAYGVLQVVPVLPAGLRPRVDNGDRVYRHDATVLYQLVLDHIARVERLRELKAPKIIEWDQIGCLQRALEALFIDGADLVEDAERGPRWVPASPDATPRSMSLRHLLAFSGWANAIDAVVRSGARPLSRSWPGLAYEARAWLEASALEVVTLRDDGTVDEAALAESLVDRRSQIFGQVYEEHLGPLYERVIHVADDPAGQRAPEPPHIDVYATAVRADGTRLLVTAGASAREMPPHPRLGPAERPRIELVMKVAGALEPALLEHLMVELRSLARYPFVTGSFIAPLHSVNLGRPIAPGSPIEHVVFIEPRDEDLALFELVSRVLPMEPLFVLTVGITTAQLDTIDRPQATTAAERRIRVVGLVDPIDRATDPVRNATPMRSV